MTATPITPNTAVIIPSPNDQLAIQITDALVTAGLIQDRHKEELFGKLKSGGVSQDDWNMWIDLATAPETVTEEADDE